MASKRALKASKTAPREPEERPKRAPKESQEGPGNLRDGPKRAPRPPTGPLERLKSPRRPQDTTKRAPEASKMAPRGPRDGPKRPPRRSQSERSAKTLVVDSCRRRLLRPSSSCPSLPICFLFFFFLLLLPLLLLLILLLLLVFHLFLSPNASTYRARAGHVVSGTGCSERANNVNT